MADGIEIYFNARVTSGQREMIEQSVASMIERRRAEIDAARIRSAEEDKLRDLITAPLAKLMHSDPEAAEALEKIIARKIEGEDSLQPTSPPGGARDYVIPVSPTDDIVDLHVPPFDFAYRWQDNAGASPYAEIGDQRGQLSMDSRAGGLIQGGADRFVHAHMGVGCVVHADRQIVVDLFATRSSRYSFIVGAYGIGANATSEGGLETTLMRGSVPVIAGSFPLWRKRVSGPSEQASDNTNFMGGVYPNGMGGRIDPGDYVFNAGIYAFADYTSGVGSAGAQSIVQSNILDLRVHRRG